MVYIESNLASTACDSICKRIFAFRSVSISLSQATIWFQLGNALGRQFLQSLTSATISTARTETSINLTLMTKFYEKMLKQGQRPAAALRAAQVEMWKQKQWQSPYYCVHDAGRMAVSVSRRVTSLRGRQSHWFHNRRECDCAGEHRRPPNTLLPAGSPLHRSGSNKGATANTPDQGHWLGNRASIKGPIRVPVGP